VVWAASGPGGIGVSDDYGATFRVIKYQIFENRSNPHICYGLDEVPGRLERPDLSISQDNGSSWNTVGGLGSLFGRLYRGRDEYGAWRTWRNSNDDIELTLQYPVQSIETDPSNSDIFYIFSQYKGIYRTLDGGKTFRILPLAVDKYLEIEAMTVDPVDGRYLYAILASRELYRSVDYGCSWQKLKLPQ
jgi:hypothetical protein